MLKQVKTIAEVRAARAGLPAPVGFVATMGALHQGHLSLVRAALQECASVVASIFVNPAQFGPREDLAKYPRPLSRDLALLEQAGVALAFTPDVDEIYPPGFQTWVTVDEVTQPLEGKIRPGHFRGVTTVVAKLFNIIQPDLAYFGQKDAQQALVLRRMVQDLAFPLRIVVCPTLREVDGLAMSSRNMYLSPDERRAATVLYRALSVARDAYAAGERDAARLRDRIEEIFRQEPVARVQYISIADPQTLEELQTIRQGALVSTAAFIGETRLIDNVLLDLD